MYDDKNRIMDYRITFGTPEGKRVLTDLADRHWMFRGTFGSEPLGNAFREGERNVVLDILRYLELKPADMETVRASITDQFGLNEEAL